MSIHRCLSYLVRAGLVLGTVSMGSLSDATAQSFPSNVIRIVVPTAPSTPPDIISRAIATELSESEGWKVIVENRPGAVQTIAGSDVLKQPADGTSIYAMSLPVSAAPALLPNMPFKPDSDFAPVVRVSTSYNVLVVHPSISAKSVSELVTLIKSQPDKLTFSSGGFGTPAHLIGEMFKLQTGARATHVPYQQFPQAIADLLNGTNHFMFITTLPVVDLISSGKLRAKKFSPRLRLHRQPVSDTCMAGQVSHPPTSAPSQHPTITPSHHATVTSAGNSMVGRCYDVMLAKTYTRKRTGTRMLLMPARRESLG